MRPFTYHNPTRILFGEGRIRDLAREVPAGARVMVTLGGGSARANGTLDQVLGALPGQPVVFEGIEPNPTYETLMKGVALARAEGVDFLLAVGGGSVLDGTKFLAAAIPFPGEDPWDLVVRKAPVEAALPFGTVLTLPATGSEMNSGAVISRKALGLKLPFGSPLLFPRFSVLDPATTVSLPARQVANGVVDAFVHVTEQYLTYPAGGDLQDRFSEGILRTLVEVGPRTLADPTDLEARGTFTWCATQALNGLVGAGVPQDWATHMIGHELTAAFGLDHARSLAVVLPALLLDRIEAKEAKLAQYGRRVWDLEGDDRAVALQAVQCTRTFFESMGVPTRLSGHGVGREDLPRVVEALASHGMSRLGEHGDIVPEVAGRILEAAL